MARIAHVIPSSCGFPDEACSSCEAEAPAEVDHLTQAVGFLREATRATADALNAYTQALDHLKALADRDGH